MAYIEKSQFESYRNQLPKVYEGLGLSKLHSFLSHNK